MGSQVLTPAAARQILITPEGRFTGDGVRFLNALLALQAQIGSWQAWTPTITASGSMTVSGVTVNQAISLTLGPLTFFDFDISLTLGGTIDSYVFITGLVTLVGFAPQFVGFNLLSGAQALVAFQSPSPVQFRVSLTGGYSAGAARLVGNGAYRST